MWLWLIFAALANTNLSPSLAEPVGNDVQDVPDDPMYLYMNERTLKDPKSNYNIETRRRSPLDMNFIRLGKRDYFSPMNRLYDSKDMDYNDEFNRLSEASDSLPDSVSSRRDSYKSPSESPDPKDCKRNGKEKSYTNFVRFGRGFLENLAKESRARDLDFGKRRDYTNYIRLGRNPYRDMSEMYREDKRQHSNSMRFGKKSTGFMRFG